MPLAPSADGRAVFPTPRVHHTPALGHGTPGQALPPAPREAAPSESPPGGPRITLGLGLPFPSAPRPAQGQKYGHCLGNKHSSGHLQPMNRRPWSSWSRRSPRPASARTHAYQARTRCARPCCGHTGDPAPFAVDKRGRPAAPAAGVQVTGPQPASFASSAAFGPWGRRVSVSPLTGRGPKKFTYRGPQPLE